MNNFPIGEFCPNCGYDQKDEEYTDEDGNKRYYIKTIGIYCRDIDMTFAWKCPNCGFEKLRDHPTAKAKYGKYYDENGISKFHNPNISS